MMKKIAIDSFDVLIRFWEHSSEPWGIKDNQSKFIYANNRFNKLLDLPDKYNVEGRSDGELPTPISEFEVEFQEHDRKVELLQDRITSVEVHEWDGLHILNLIFVIS
ncbi:LuxR family transcription regulatory protein, partial [Yersinia frederiksenii ATCC 33641]